MKAMLQRQEQVRRALLRAARRWAALAAAPASGWSTEVRATNRAGKPVRVRVAVSYVPDEEEL